MGMAPRFRDQQTEILSVVYSLYGKGLLMKAKGKSKDPQRAV